MPAPPRTVAVVVDRPPAHECHSGRRVRSRVRAVRVLLPAAVAVVGWGPTHARADAIPVTAPDAHSAHQVRASVPATPNDDPGTADAWHLLTDAPMGIRTAWSRVSGGDVTVAVIDSGIALDHPDLTENLWTNTGEIAGNGIDDDRDGTVDDIHGVDLIGHDGDPEDDNGHGTHVAGIIGARGGNGIGISGVARRVRLMAVKVVDAATAGTGRTVADGVRWAVDHGARIINISLVAASPSPALDLAIADAHRAGVLVVVAAGNEGQDLAARPSYPAAAGGSDVLAVAATRSDGWLTVGSNFGPSADLAAPGDAILSTARGGGYEYRTGTSMAAPMVSGAAALLLAADASLDADRLSAVLERTARPGGLPVRAGALDVGAALGGPPTVGITSPAVGAAGDGSPRPAAVPSEPAHAPADRRAGQRRGRRVRGRIWGRYDVDRRTWSPASKRLSGRG